MWACPSGWKVFAWKVACMDPFTTKWKSNFLPGQLGSSSSSLLKLQIILRNNFTDSPKTSTTTESIFKILSPQGKQWQVALSVSSRIQPHHPRLQTFMSSVWWRSLKFLHRIPSGCPGSSSNHFRTQGTNCFQFQTKWKLLRLPALIERRQIFLKISSLKLVVSPNSRSANEPMLVNCSHHTAFKVFDDWKQYLASFLY